MIGTRWRPELCLEFCSARDPRYQDIRSRHYVPNRGAQARQLHFLVRYEGSVVGVISAGSSVWSGKLRDSFFRITKANQNKAINGIANNTVFRLEHHKRHLASRVVALWRKVVSILWKELYGDEVYGFETLIEPNPEIGRDGKLYRGDNWQCVGAIPNGKLLHCRWRAGFDAPVESVGESCWRQKTVEEKRRARTLADKRKSHLGQFFWLSGRAVVSSTLEETA